MTTNTTKEVIADLQSYVDSTYGEHYSINNFQATEFIIDGGHGEGFCMVISSSMHNDTVRRIQPKRFDEGVHYAIIALHVHDLEQE